MASGRTPTDGLKRLAMILIAVAALWFLIAALALALAGHAALLLPALVATPLTLATLVAVACRLPDVDPGDATERDTGIEPGRLAVLGSDHASLLR